MSGLPVLASLRTRRALRWLLRVVGAILLADLAASFVVGASRPADPHLLPAAAAAGLGGHSSRTSRVPGFGQIEFRVFEASGTVGRLRCALLADSDAAHQKGMKGRHDLAGYDAMLFRWPAVTTVGFFNQGVPIPLTVAWFDSAGVFISAADMAVCTTNCPTFSPPIAYHLALEVRRGGLSRLGVGPGSVLSIGSHC